MHRDALFGRYTGSVLACPRRMREGARGLFLDRRLSRRRRDRLTPRFLRTVVGYPIESDRGPAPVSQLAVVQPEGFSHSPAPT